MQTTKTTRDYLRLLWRRKYTVVLATVVVTCAAVGFTVLQTPQYAASAEVLLQPRITDDLFSNGTDVSSDPVRASQTEIQLVTSERVASVVRAAEGLTETPDVTATPLGQSDIIEITARADSADRAMAIANAYATAYIDFRRGQAAEDMATAQQQLQARITEIDTQIAALAGDPAQVDADRDALIAQRTELTKRLDQLAVEATLVSGGAQVVTPATAPSSPVSPTPLRNVAVGLAFGLLLGVGLALLFERLDDSVRTAADLERFGSPLSTIALVPAANRLVLVGDDSGKRKPAATTADYDTLCNWLRFLQLQRSVCVVQFTSPEHGDAKTLLITELASALVTSGQRVAVVGCDPGSSSLAVALKAKDDAGVASVLTGKTTVRLATQLVSGTENLSVVAPGPLPEDPSSLLVSDRATAMFDSLRRDFDVVLVDTAPVAGSRPGAPYAWADAIVMVAEAGKSSGRAIERTADVLRHVDPPLTGMVLHGISAKHARSAAK